MGIFDSYAAYSGLADGSIYEGAYGIDETKLLEEEAYLEEMDSAEVDDDPIEACIEAVLINEQNFNNIMNAVAYDEMKYFVENGVEMIYEEGRISKFFSMIKSGIDKAWAKVKAIFEKVLTAIESWVRSDKAFVSKYKDKIESASGIKYKGYNIPKEARNAKIYEKLGTEFKRIYDRYSGGSKELYQGQKADELLDKFRGDALNRAPISSDNFASTLKTMFGLDNKVDLTYNGSDIISELISGKETKKNTKAGYVAAKKYFGLMKSVVKAAESGAKSTAKNKGADSNTGSYGFMSKLCSTGISCCNTAQRIHIGALNKYHHQCRAMAAMAVRGSKKAENESGLMFDGDTEDFGFII